MAAFINLNYRTYNCVCCLQISPKGKEAWDKACISPAGLKTKNQMKVGLAYKGEDSNWKGRGIQPSIQILRSIRELLGHEIGGRGRGHLELTISLLRKLHEVIKAWIVDRGWGQSFVALTQEITQDKTFKQTKRPVTIWIYFC